MSAALTQPCEIYVIFSVSDALRELLRNEQFRFHCRKKGNDFTFTIDGHNGTVAFTRKQIFLSVFAIPLELPNISSESLHY